MGRRGGKGRRGGGRYRGGKRGRREGRDRVPKLLLNQGPSEPYYATVGYIQLFPFSEFILNALHMLQYITAKISLTKNSVLHSIILYS